MLKLLKLFVLLSWARVSAHEERAAGVRRSLRAAGWFGPTEFHKQIDITMPEHTVHREALEELKEKHGTAWIFDDVHHVDTGALNIMHTLLDKKRAAASARRSEGAAAAPSDPPSSDPSAAKEEVHSPDHVDEQTVEVKEEVQGGEVEAARAEPTAAGGCNKPAPKLLDISGSAVEVPLTDADYARGFDDAEVAYLARLERVVRKLETGEPVRVFAYGGSVTVEHGCSFEMAAGSFYEPLFEVKPSDCTMKHKKDCNPRGPCGWTGAFGAWLRKAFPDNPHIEVQNHAAGATGVGYFVAQAAMSDPLPHDVDLFVLEYAQNNLGDAAEIVRSDEAAIRQVLALPQAPALVMLEFAFVSGCNGVLGSARTENHVAKHYRVPMLNFHKTAFAKYAAASSMEMGGAGGTRIMKRCCEQTNGIEVEGSKCCTREELSAAGLGRALFHNMAPPKYSTCSDHHPKAVIHHQMANSLAWLVLRARSRLCQRGGKREPIIRALPGALYAVQAKTIFTADVAKGAAAFKATCWDATGSKVPCEGEGTWLFYEDREGKPGWIATRPGARITFKIKGCTENLVIAFMRSYEKVGKVSATMSTCESGPCDSCADAAKDPRYGRFYKANPNLMECCQIYIRNPSLEPRVHGKARGLTPDSDYNRFYQLNCTTKQDSGMHNGGGGRYLDPLDLLDNARYALGAKQESEPIVIDAYMPDKRVSIFTQQRISKRNHPSWCTIAKDWPAHPNQPSFLHLVLQDLTAEELAKRGGSQKFKLLMLAGA